MGSGFVLLGTLGSIWWHFCCHPWVKGWGTEYWSWHLGNGGQKCCSTSHNAQNGSTTQNYFIQNVSSAEDKKPCFRQWHLFSVLKWKENLNANFFWKIGIGVLECTLELYSQGVQILSQFSLAISTYIKMCVWGKKDITDCRLLCKYLYPSFPLELHLPMTQFMLFTPLRP